MSIFKLIYKINPKLSIIKIFDSYFSDKYKNKFLLNINNKKIKLDYKYNIKNPKNAYLKIKLLIFDNHRLNLRKCFSKCFSLIEFHAKEKTKTNNENYENDSKDEENNSNNNNSLDKSLSSTINLFDSYLFKNIKNLSESQFFCDDFDSIQISEISEAIKSFNDIKSLSKMKSMIPGQDNLSCIDMSYMFNECKNIKIISGLNNLDTKEVRNMENLFNGCFSLISLPDISKWNIENVLNLEDMFNSCCKLISLPDISKWNTKNLLYLSGTFLGCSSLESLPDISKWNVINVKSLSELFYGCSSLKSLPDISKWNTSNVILMDSIFEECHSIEIIPFISEWNTNKVITMSKMFNDCFSLSSLPDISKWNTKNVVNISYMFNNCYNLISLPNINKWNGRNFKIMDSFCNGCSSLIHVPDISEWESFKTISMKYMFDNCPKLKFKPDLTVFDNKNSMNYIFKSKINNMENISDKIEECFKRFKIKNNLEENFDIPPLYELSKISYKIDPNEYAIKIFHKTFVEQNKFNCLIIYKDNIYPLTEYFPMKLIDLTKENRLEIILREFIEINNKNYMFFNCTSLEGFPEFKDHQEFLKYLIKDETYIYLNDTKKYQRIYLNNDNKKEIEKEMIIQKDVNKNNIKICPSLSFLSNKIKLYNFCPDSICFMFHNCSSLISLPDISNWDTKNVFTISSLFDGCSSLISLPNLSKWKLNTCEQMSSVFRGCSSLISLPDISGWIINNVQDFPELFKGCSSLVSLPDISKWNTENIHFMDALLYFLYLIYLNGILKMY